MYNFVISLFYKLELPFFLDIKSKKPNDTVNIKQSIYLKR